MSAWLLPDDVADALPSAARHIEQLRRTLLDTAGRFGYEQVIPPLIEYVESLLSGTGKTLDLQTFKLVDQLCGRTLGVRADCTPQVARIDAHLLGRSGVTRLCYAGPVLHTRAERPHATREPLQFGAEIYGHAGIEADLEAMDLALQCLLDAEVAQPQALHLDLADVRIVNALLSNTLDPKALDALHHALSSKDRGALANEAQALDLPAPTLQALLALTRMHGPALPTLDAAEQELSKVALANPTLLQKAIADMRHAILTLQAQHPTVRLSVDLADLQGYAYYTGMRFAVYAQGMPDSLARGGRYDAVGASFGRNRPAVGFSLDIKEIQSRLPDQDGKDMVVNAIRAPWSLDPGLRQAVHALRQRGETVLCLLPGQEQEADTLHCDRELLAQGGQWLVRALETP